MSRHEPVAIVGIGCRFPGGVDGPSRFWRFVSEGHDAIGEIPADRIDLGHFFDPRPATPGRIMSRWGGFLDRIDRFDADFFGIAPREAERIDPQQRLLLEIAWEALEDAGLTLDRLQAGRCGVFVGQWLNDFEAPPVRRPGGGRLLHDDRQRPLRRRRAASRMRSGCAARASRSTPPARRRWWRSTWPRRHPQRRMRSSRSPAAST